LLSILSSLAALQLGGAILESRYKVKRHISELRDEGYDFIIAGGGTSGLTIADRLSEAFPRRNILVVEYGDIEYAPGYWDPPKTVWGDTSGMASRLVLNSLPSPDLNNNTAYVIIGQVVGGSSATNGMFFDRGSRFDYDTWNKLQAVYGEKSDISWDWEGLYPYFEKSVSFVPPPTSIANKFNYTWDTSVFGNSTDIYASLPPFQWGDHFVARKAWAQMGINETKECAGGSKEGLCWIPISQHPITARRSYAGIGHYSSIERSRQNYHLLVKHQVTRLLYPQGNPKIGPPIIEVRSLHDGQLSNITAKSEVLLSAGVFGTPSILQRSGIGPATLLRSANISLVLDLPGVGANLQDHSGPQVQWEYTKPPNFRPDPSEMLDPSFAAKAELDFNSTPAAGPYTLAMSNSAIWISLSNMTTNYSTILTRIHKLAAETLSKELHLPADYESHATLAAGYQVQLVAIANLLANPHAPSLESAFSTGTSVASVLLHPLSRGTVRLNMTNPLQPPVLDYRSASNPIDFDLHLIHLRYLRRMLQTDTLQALTAIETMPGAGVWSDEGLKSYIRNNTVQSFMHPCCTTAMLPLSQGGVVRPNLSVHGAAGLRIIDAGVFPILPSAHLSATMYAVAEKAADIIIKQWSDVSQ
ncbi:hypothetical protein B0T25DRAFT_602439, partial [Lasiosphaeria hispida]